jgi:hypothetical protein
MTLKIIQLSFACLAYLVSFASFAQDGPTFAVRSAALRSLVHINAKDCPADPNRSGSGFTLDSPGTIVTAHHVVGGCKKITVRYEGVVPGTPSIFSADLVRVLPDGDLALLTVAGAPVVPVLQLALTPVDKNDEFAGFGYQNGQFSASDVSVTFGSGGEKLNEVLTESLLKELTTLNSPIDRQRKILRFRDALQPGMSGGPIIDKSGRVIGIVAGGLKAGAAPASWGWPSQWISSLKISSAPVSIPILTAGAYYSTSDLDKIAVVMGDDKKLQCGALTMRFIGARMFSDLAVGADDGPRLQHIMQISGMSLAQLNSLSFEVWQHIQSGATALLPAGISLQAAGGICKASSADGELTQLIWGANAMTQYDVQQMSVQFEGNVIMPRLPQLTMWQFDPQLTTLIPNGYQWVPGPQHRANGLVFSRKGLIYPKDLTRVPNSPNLHVFETLIARSGTFLGVGTINEEVDPQIAFCFATGFNGSNCSVARERLNRWTHFILATQLSTYPAN